MARLKKFKFNSTDYLFPVEDVKVGTTSVVTDGVATIDLSDINTKTFYLSSTSDITTAQAALDWYLVGNNPIVVYSGDIYLFNTNNTANSYIEFYWYADSTVTVGNVSPLRRYYVKITYNSSNIVTQISTGNKVVASFLATDVNYTTPYTPQYDGSPATKKYVDDRDTYIGSSAPTSNLVEGRLWYDTANDKLKVYDGTNWNEVGGSSQQTFYVTQAEYEALLPGAASDGNNYVIIETTLKTYAEIVAMATDEGNPWTNTIAELNTYPQEYYNMLLNGNNLVDITISSGGPSYKAIDGISSYNPGLMLHAGIFWNINGDNTWTRKFY